MIPPTPEQEALFESMGNDMEQVAAAGALVSAPFRAIFKTSINESLLVMVRFKRMSTARKAVSYLVRQVSKRHVLREEHARKFLDFTTSSWGVDTSKRPQLENLLKLSELMNEPYTPTLKFLLTREIQTTRLAFIWNVSYNDEDSKYFGHIVWDKKEALTPKMLKACKDTGMIMIAPGSLQDAASDAKADAKDDKRVLAALENKCYKCQKPVTLKTRRLCSGCKAARYCSQECQLKHWKAAEGGHEASCVKLGKLVRAIQRREVERQE